MHNPNKCKGFRKRYEFFCRHRHPWLPQSPNSQNNTGGSKLSLEKEKTYKRLRKNTKENKRTLRNKEYTNDDKPRVLNTKISNAIKRDLRKYNCERIAKTIEEESMKVLQRNLEQCCNYSHQIWGGANIETENSFWSVSQLIHTCNNALTYPEKYGSISLLNYLYNLLTTC